MRRPFAVVSVAVVALVIAAGVFIFVRDHGGSMPERVSAGPIQGSIGADHMPARTADERVRWPADIENLIWEYFAHRGKSNITSIISVECTRTDCEIVFTGTEVDPKFVDTFSDLHSDMYAQPWNVRQSSIGTVEIAPGVRAYVIGISNIPHDDSRRGTADQDRALDATEE